MGIWGEVCPNCGSKEVEKISENEVFCPDCNESFKREKGKVSHEPKSLVKQLQDKVAEQDKKIEDLHKQLNPDDGFFGF